MPRRPLRAETSLPRISVLPPGPADRVTWEQMARAYKLDQGREISALEYRKAWQKIRASQSMFGLIARLEGRSVGFVHYLYHTNFWHSPVCYLQDLFTIVDARRQGVGRALIEAVAEHARGRGAARLYWLAKESNLAGRALYGQLANFSGVIRYDYPLAR